MEPHHEQDSMPQCGAAAARTLARWSAAAGTDQHRFTTTTGDANQNAWCEFPFDPSQRPAFAGLHNLSQADSRLIRALTTGELTPNALVETSIASHRVSSGSIAGARSTAAVCETMSSERAAKVTTVSSRAMRGSHGGPERNCPTQA